MSLIKNLMHKELPLSHQIEGLLIKFGEGTLDMFEKAKSDPNSRYNRSSPQEKARRDKSAADLRYRTEIIRAMRDQRRAK